MTSSPQNQMGFDFVNFAHIKNDTTMSIYLHVCFENDQLFNYVLQAPFKEIQLDTFLNIR